MPVEQNQRPRERLRRAVDASGGTLPCQVDTLILQLGFSPDEKDVRSQVAGALEEAGLVTEPELDGLGPEHVVLLRARRAPKQEPAAPAKQPEEHEEAPTQSVVLPMLPEWAIRRELDAAGGSLRYDIGSLLSRFGHRRLAEGTGKEIDERLRVAGIEVEPSLQAANGQAAVMLRRRGDAPAMPSSRAPLEQPAKPAPKAVAAPTPEPGAAPTPEPSSAGPIALATDSALSTAATVLAFVLICGVIGYFVGARSGDDQSVARTVNKQARQVALPLTYRQAYSAGKARGRREGTAVGRRDGSRRGKQDGTRRAHRQVRSHPPPPPPPPAPKKPATTGTTPQTGATPGTTGVGK